MISRTLALAFCIACPSLTVPALTRTAWPDISRVIWPPTHVPLRAIGYGKNDAYTAYLHMSEPSQITRAQVAALNTASKGESERTAEIQVPHGDFSRDLPLRTNDLYLVVLTPSEGGNVPPKKNSR